MQEDLTYPDTHLQSAVVERVIDGDTLLVKVDGESFRVRLIGIDAPESVAPEAERNCTEGKQASNHLKRMLSSGQIVWLQADVSDFDEHGRLLRYVWLRKPEDPGRTGQVKEHMLNAILIRQGYAVARHYPPNDTLWELFKAL